MRRSIAAVLTVCGCLAIASGANARVLLVGTFHGIHGQFKSIQAAVNAAHRGDWILIAPGDYKTKASHTPTGAANRPAAVLITKPGIYLRGMNRNTVIIDGTTTGPACNNRIADQNFGPTSGGKTLGLNGIMTWKADNVWVQNLTVCNFLGGSGSSGNGIWWNGGDGSAKIGGRGFLGSYLTATSTFFSTEKTAATYGIFSSNWNGGTWDQTYASNFNDSGYYIGACRQQCNQTMNHAWAEYNALGYSGSNSGGWLLIENSQFDKNKDGFDTNSQNGDNPPPQNGSCPKGVKPPVSGAPTCWVFTHNNVHDNNNPNVPQAGSASAGPLGTGVSVAGGRFDTILDNRFANNGAWGVVFIAYPDNGPPCTGGTVNALGGLIGCLYDDWGNVLLGNTFVHNGFLGHPSNGDFAELRLQGPNPTNCFAHNQGANGGPLTTDAAKLQQMHPVCNAASTAAENSNPQFLPELLCDTGVSLTSGPPMCPSGPYPKPNQIVMHPLPKSLRSMPNPCAGVPANPWCRKH